MNQTTQWVYDDFGRLETGTDHAGKTTTYDYDLNSQVTSVQVEGEGTTGYSYDNVGHVTQVSDPIQGTISYTRNLRGDITADEKGTYQLDLLGRPQSLTYYGGAGIETWTYTPDQKVASHTQNGGTDTYTYDAVGNLTSKNSTTFSYSGTSLLGIPSSQSGGGDSYSFSYDNRHYLSTLQNTTLGQNFTYGWSNAHELTNLSYPNGTNLTQVYSQKYNNNVTVKNSGLQTLLSGQVTRDGTTHQISQYDYSVTDGGMNTLAEIATISYHATGTLKGKINTVSYNTGKPTVTYGYDANTGRTNSLQIAGQGTYNIAYTPEGQVNTITYPNLSQEVYSYTGPKGQVSSIQYPNGTTMSMTWTAQDRVNTISETNGGSSVQNTFTYTPAGDIVNWTKVVNGSPQETWSFQYGPQGIEGATCITPSGTITQNYCTDPSGTPLAMYYTDQRGGIGQTFTGMLYFHYDNFGNTAMLTDASGVPQVLYQYDLRTSLFTSINANNIRNPFTSLGEEGAITDSLTLTTNVDWTLSRGKMTLISEIYDETMSTDREKLAKELCKKRLEKFENIKSDYQAFLSFDCSCFVANGRELSDHDKETLKKEYMDKGATEEQADQYIQATQTQISICCHEKGKYATLYTPKQSDGAVPGTGPVREGENLDKIVSILHCKDENNKGIDARYIGSRNGVIGYWTTFENFIPVAP